VPESFGYQGLTEGFDSFQLIEQECFGQLSVKTPEGIPAMLAAAIAPRDNRGMGRAHSG
jgi:hypothetical protein